ncbi:Serine/threonine-protein kinase SKY1, partial [Talaromyces pinophilus]
NPKTSNILRHHHHPHNVNSRANNRRVRSIQTRRVSQGFAKRHIRLWQGYRSQKTWLWRIPRSGLLEIPSRAEKYIAIKILRADSYGSVDGQYDIFEREILSEISDVSRHSIHEGRHYVLPALHEFTRKGPDGEHLCLVFDRLPVKSVKSIAGQFTRIGLLHSECGIIRTDLQPSYLIMESEDPEKTISQYLSENAPRIDDEGTPLREVISTPLLSAISNPHIRMIDFGVGAAWDGKVDNWSLGCLIIEFTHGVVLFNGEGSENGKWTVDDDRLARAIEVLGAFPPELLAQGTRTAEYVNDKGSSPSPSSSSSLEQVLNRRVNRFIRPEELSEKEVYVFIDFVKGMLTVDPSERKSAAGLLGHEWLVK